MKTVFKWVSLLCLGIFLSACSKEPETLQGNIFGTFFQVTIAGSERYEREEVEQGVLEVLNRVDMQMSTYKEQSNLMQLNQAPVGVPFPVPAELFEVLELSLDVSEASGGAFDNTVGGLVNLWGFGPEGRVTSAPPNELLQTRLARVGYNKVELDAQNQTATRLADVFIDLSGIAKGYAVDQVSEYLLDLGIENFLVNIGGDLRSQGKRSEDAMWRVGIEVPTDQRQMAQHILPLTNMAILGSGDYRNYFEENGVRYSHTINPTNGRPIAHRLAAVHVLLESAAEADAWATALLVLGEQRGLSLANELGIDAVFIYREGNDFATLMSNSFKANHEAQLEIPTVL
ncbi:MULTISPECIES: FAD:protein FMN transferase [Gammaproteobacteria]|uniref:FAD:protein FMN transferase n=1 Tax=Gammaproteobacteria TaxID=1236 RepID=UPI000DD047EE|nr:MULTISPECIES: FAD:protein FMN transferase [Gammaproteobacteria]RTE86757.1 FAD:protein FMN transferase [Aliidiomarina sp. B3213]TCZ90689.1 FAD:protein FMN transferase [Lysobacter sp. N42]